MTTALAWVRRATAKRGALVAGPGSGFTETVVDELERRRLAGTLGQCEHLDMSEDGSVIDGNGDPTVVLLRVSGPLAYVLQCPACWADLSLDDGCEACSRPLTFGRRLVMTPARPGFAFVMVTVLCRDCRKGSV